MDTLHLFLKIQVEIQMNFLGHRNDLTPEKIGEIAKRFKDNGATILGGCCETRPSHIEAMAKLK